VTRIQQVLFELETEYYGHPYHVTGNALYQAIAQRVAAATRRVLCVSHGVFLPGEYGSYPAWHSQSGSIGKVGSELPPVESYDDLFLFRDAAQRWLKTSRPRDAHNVQPMQTHGGRITFDRVVWFGRPSETRTAKRGVRWYLQCYLHAAAGADEVLPVAADVLDGLQVGGGRNYGFGVVSHVDSQLIEVAELSFDRVAAADAHVIELVTPYVLASEYPGADDQSVPGWWELPADVTGQGLRRRDTRLVAGDTVNAVATVDHGQVVWYAGSTPVRTARNGVTRVGTHAKYGFGELRVRPASDLTVPAPAADEDATDSPVAATGGDG